MADDNKVQHKDAPAKESNERTESHGTATAVREQTEAAKATVTPMTTEASVNKLATGLQGADAQRDGKTITLAMGSPYQNLKGDGLTLSAPGGDGQQPPGGDGKGKPALDAQGLIKTDGKVDMPPKPADMSDADYERQRKAVEAFNKNINDPKNGLTDQQKKDLERSAEQLLSNKNPDGSERRPPLDPREGTKVLEQANRMFDNREQIRQNFGKDGAGQDKMGDAQQNLAITAMVHDPATPTDANQGMNNTCNVSAAAKAEMMQHPGEQAKHYADMFTSKDGYVNFPDGKGGQQRVQIDRDSIVPDREASFAADHVGGGARDAYMQGLNHLYVNAVTQQRGEYYTDGRPEFKGDTGERLHKGSFSGDVVMKQDGTGRPENSPAMGAEDVQRVMNMTGAGHVAADYDRFGVRPGSGVLQVTGGDPKSLDRAWDANGGKPMVIAVDTNAAMFQAATDVGGKTTGGGHVVTLADRRENPPGSGKFEYLMQNSWGNKYNGWVSGDAVASAMNPQNGDRSGNIPAAGADKGGSGANWGEQTYHRPDGSGNSGGNYQTQGDGSGYGQGKGSKGGGEYTPQRDSSGIKTGTELDQEQARRKQAMDEEEKRLNELAKQHKLDEEEQQRLANIKKLKQEEQEREEAEKKRRAAERPRSGDGGDPNNN